MELIFAPGIQFVLYILDKNHYCCHFKGSQANTTGNHLCDWQVTHREQTSFLCFLQFINHMLFGQSTTKI